MADQYVIDKNGVRRRLQPGDVVGDGEMLFVPFTEMHQPARLKLTDAEVAGMVFRDKPEPPKADPAATFTDPYGRTLVAGPGENVAAGRALGAQLSYEQRVGNAWKEPFPAPPEGDPVTYGGSGKAKGQQDALAGNGQEAYEQRLRDAWRAGQG